MEWLAARIAISWHSVCCRYVYRVKQTNEILHAQRMPGAFVISEICQSQDTDIISKLPILFNARLQEHTNTHTRSHLRAISRFDCTLHAIQLFTHHSHQILFEHFCFCSVLFVCVTSLFSRSVG